MNARGLMELIVINIGLQRGIISEGLFATLVIMAVLAMLMASPLFERLAGSRIHHFVPEPEAEKQANPSLSANVTDRHLPVERFLKTNVLRLENTSSFASARLASRVVVGGGL